MHGIIGSFRLGEDIAVALDAVEGDLAAVTAITAKMKPAKVTTNRIVLDDQATAIILNVAVRGTAGWVISMSSSATAALEPGVYGIDARLTFAGAIEMTEQSGFIALTRAAVA